MYPNIKDDGVFFTALFWLYVIAWVLPWNGILFVVDMIKYATTPGRR